MPILVPNSDAIEGMFDKYVSELPGSVVQNGQMNPAFASIVAADFGARHIEDALDLGALVGRDVSMATGWPTDQLDQLSNLVSVVLGPGVNPDIVGEVLANMELVAELLGDLEKSLTNAISSVPILGWIINLGIVVYKIVKIARFNAPKVTGNEPLAYDKGADEEHTTSILKRVKGRDWTDLFSPQPGAFITADLAYTSTGLADGFAWGQLNQSSSEKGLVPGLPQISGYWQSPRKVPGSRRDPNVANIVTTASLTPSVTSLSGLLWTANQASGVMLARIDLHALAGRWNAYGEEFERWLDARGPGNPKSGVGGSSLVTKQIKNGWRWTDPTYGAALYGLERKDVPPEYRGWGLQNLIAYQLELARNVVRENMKTTAVAYVSPDAPGLSDGPTKQQWAKARMLLLMHPARYTVDASIIPDKDYRMAMYGAQQRRAIDFAIEGAGPKIKPGITNVDKLSGREPIEPYLPLPSGSSMPPGRGRVGEGLPIHDWPGRRQGRPPTKSAVKKILFTAAVLGGGGYLARKKGWI